MTNTSLAPKTRQKTQRPKRYTVKFVNDDFTPMDFVIDVLVQIFNQSLQDAERIMFQIHRSGSGNVGLYTREIAETKVLQAQAAAQRYEHPFLCEAVEA